MNTILILAGIILDCACLALFLTLVCKKIKKKTEDDK